MKFNKELRIKIYTVLFCVALVISNVVTARIVPFPFGLTVAGAVLIYPITFLITDIIGELYGKEEANKIVKYGLVSQVFATILIFLTGLLPCVDPDDVVAFDKLLGQNWIIVLGSLIAYYCSQSWDVYVFHKIRNKFIADGKSSFAWKWVWNNASTITSQFIDTAIFITISFGIGFGWLANGQYELYFSMLFGQYIIKIILALLDTPFFYFFTRKRVVDSDERNAE